MPDEAITEATVMYGETAKIGSRVKHYAERYTPYATATVTGFSHDSKSHSWVKVHIKHDNPGTVYSSPWDWDRTELTPDQDN